MVTITIILASISILLTFVKYVLDYNNRLIEILQSLFYLDNEFNIPTYWSSVLLLAAALLLTYIFFQKNIYKDQYRYFWMVLAGVFLLLSMDEFMIVHERMTDPMQSFLGNHDWLYLAWVVPASIALCIGVLFYLKFLFSLRPSVRMRFIFSALLYIGGAIGFELVGGYIIVNEGMRNFMYASAANLEEILEMLGVAYFNFTLLSYISTDLQQKISISFQGPDDKATKPTSPLTRHQSAKKPATKKHS